VAHRAASLGRIHPGAASEAAGGGGVTDRDPQVVGGVITWIVVGGVVWGIAIAAFLAGYLVRHALGHRREADAYSRGQLDALDDSLSGEFIARQRKAARYQ
jgi:hypothetical protein